MDSLAIALAFLGILAWDAFRRYRAETELKINRVAEEELWKALGNVQMLTQGSEARLKQLEQRVGAMTAFRK